MKNNINVAVLGSTGYTGLELVVLLSNHPKVSIKFLGSNSNAGKNINTFDQRLKKISLPKLDKFNNLNYSSVDVVFLSLPHSLSQKIVCKNFGKTVFIDLSADFRIKNKKIYKKNYKNSHFCPKLLNKFTYGLPEINFKEINNSANIAVPGCYPTSVLLPLIPILKDKLISSKNIIIDSKSGYSGAGKNFEKSNLINKTNYNFYNYNTNEHRHMCEIDQELSNYCKSKINFSFNPHILPIFRGLISTIYCDLSKNVNKKKISDFLNKFYNKKKFVNILNKNEKCDFYSIYKTNNCLIKLYKHYNSNKIIIVSAIDNLLKGASGQAIQCMNIVFKFKENEGLNKLLK